MNTNTQKAQPKIVLLPLEQWPAKNRAFFDRLFLFLKDYFSFRALCIPILLLLCYVNETLPNNKPGSGKENHFVLTGKVNMTPPAGWQYKRQLSFNNAAQSENLVNFPVLVKLDNSRIDYNNTQNNGEDLRFYDADDVTPLAYEIEEWNESGLSYVWVNVPQVDGSSNTDYIWMYYGNTGAADAQNVSGTWNSAYEGIWHLEETSGTHLDATSNNNDGTPQGGVIQNATGQIDGADDFAGSDYINIGNPASLNIAGDITVSAWAKVNGGSSSQRPIVGKGDHQYMLRAGDENDFEFYTYNGSWDEINSNNGFTNSQWYYLVGRLSGTEVSLWVDGVKQTQTRTGGITTSSNALEIGRDSENTSRDFHGTIDEVRISNVARSGDWIAAQYLSMTDVFISYGAEIASAETNCNDAIDNDGDGLIDCADPDCGTGNNIINGCITVNSIGDGADTNPGDGYCADSNCECTLRAAIQEANALAGPDTICFNILGAGPHTIQVLTGLPNIIDQLTIDGYTQTGAVEATATTPATLQIVLSGDLLTAAANGLNVNHSNANKSVIKGLAINNFNFSNTVSGISILWADSVRIEGNHIGTNATGTSAVPNYYGVRLGNFATNSLIGGPLPLQRNVISGNSRHGIYALNFSGNGMSRMENNYIGTNASGTGAVANSNHGIHINSTEAEVIDNVISGNAFYGIDLNGSYTRGSATYVTIQGNKIGVDKNGNALGNSWAGISTQGPVYNILIGGISAGEPNIIANNGQWGIAVRGDSISIVSNAIYSNGSLGIDLGAGGVTANDAGDTDTGANDFLNFPVINSLTLNGGDVDYDFDIDLLAGDYRIELYNNPSGIDGLGNGEGELFIGAVQINHGGTGSENFTGTFTPLSAVSWNDDITAVTIECSDGTCTSFWSTSEFSVAEAVIIPEICNNSVDDDGDGQTDCVDSDCCCAKAPTLSKN